MPVCIFKSELNYCLTIEIKIIITDKQGILNTWQKYVEELYETKNRPTNLDIENETDISEDEKGFPILMEEV